MKKQTTNENEYLRLYSKIGSNEGTINITDLIKDKQKGTSQEKKELNDHK